MSIEEISKELVREVLRQSGRVPIPHLIGAISILMPEMAKGDILNHVVKAAVEVTSGAVYGDLPSGTRLH